MKASLSARLPLSDRVMERRDLKARQSGREGEVREGGGGVEGTDFQPAGSIGPK